MTRAREVAYAVLLRVGQGEAFTNLALQAALRGARLDERDRALCTEIVYGTIQRQRSIDALLGEHVQRPLEDLDQEVLTILRMTVYQLAYLDRVPAYAALHEAVELCKREKPQASGFVNGVLRQFSRVAEPAADRLSRLAGRTRDWRQALGILYSYPDWLVEAWVNRFGRERAAAIMTACNERAGLSVRVNRLRARPETVLAELRQTLREASPSPLSPWGIRLGRGLDVEAWAPYQRGDVTVQDEGAMLVAPLLRAPAGSRVLDMCAAPGAKTTHIAECMGDHGTVDACDIHPHKLRLLRQAAVRLGLSSIRTMLCDARQLPSRPGWAQAFDAVLLDAPCSGLGVLRHRPDIRWRRTPPDVASLQALQRELIAAAAQLVRPGGVVVYATCTLLPEENEDVVRWAVEEADLGLVWDDIRPDLPPAAAELVEGPAAGLTLTPDRFQTDGFFMARLKKRTEA